MLRPGRANDAPALRDALVQRPQLAYGHDAHRFGPGNDFIFFTIFPRSDTTHLSRT